MTLDVMDKEKIKHILKSAILDNFTRYEFEDIKTPFYWQMIGQDRMFLYLFIQSLNFQFDISITKPIIQTIVKDRFKKAAFNVAINNRVSDNALQLTQKIMDGLVSADRSPNRKQEIEALKLACATGTIEHIKVPRVDVFLEKDNREVFLMYMKPLKPYSRKLLDTKRTLLNWAAVEITENPDVDIHTLIAIPYNPYEPKPYDRWTFKGLFDIKQELMIGKELWDFLGGDGTYEDLLDCFEQAGIELRPEMDAYFSRFR